MTTTSTPAANDLYDLGGASVSDAIALIDGDYIQRLPVAPTGNA